MTTIEFQERLLAFSSQTIDLVDQIPKTYAGAHIGKQLLRSSVSIGANYEEAQGAESKADFTHKLQISLKECRESHYWLKLLAKKAMRPHSLIEKLLNESGQLSAILSKAVVTAKSRR
jgi:four helix bundle protein